MVVGAEVMLSALSLLLLLVDEAVAGGEVELGTTVDEVVSEATATVLPFESLVSLADLVAIVPLEVVAAFADLACD